MNMTHEWLKSKYVKTAAVVYYKELPVFLFFSGCEVSPAEFWCEYLAEYKSMALKPQYIPVCRNFNNAAPDWVAVTQ
jgi:hypothetical protein